MALMRLLESLDALAAKLPQLPVTLGFLVATVAAAFLSVIGIQQRIDWDAAAMVHGGGHMYVVRLKPWSRIARVAQRARVHVQRAWLAPRPGRLAVLRAATFACTAAAAVSALLALSGVERRIVIESAGVGSGGGKMFTYALKS